MKLTTTKSELKSAVATAAAIANQKTTLPILSHVLMSASNGNLSVIGGNTDIQITASAMIADTAAAFEIAIPAERLSKILGTLDDSAAIVLEAKDGKATVKSGKSNSSFATLPAVQYPVQTVSGNAQKFVIDAAAFKAQLATVFKSAAKNDVRYMLNGVCLDASDDGLDIVATDGFRAAVAHAPVFGAKFNVIISRETVAQLLKALNDGELAVLVYENHITFLHADWQIQAKTVAAKYPDWRRVIPAMSDGVSVDCETMRASIARAAVAVTMPRFVSLVCEAGTLTITGGKADDSSSDSMDLPHPDFEHGCNVDYLADAVSSFGEVVNFKATDRQLWFWHGDVRVVVMPQRI